MKVFVVERLICGVNKWCCRQLLLVCTKDVLQCWRMAGRPQEGSVTPWAGVLIELSLRRFITSINNVAGTIYTHKLVRPEPGEKKK